MRFYNHKHKHTCGIDLHGKTLYVCVLDQEYNTLFHRQIPSCPKTLGRVLKPFREDLVIGVECMFSWYWVADWCTNEDIPFVLGHALEMKAVHGAKSGNDRLDSLRIAKLLAGGLFPMAYVYPRGMRATRDLMRRRCFFVAKRGGLISHIQNTNTQENLPPIEYKITRCPDQKALVERFEEPCVRMSIAADLAIIDTYNKVIRKLDCHILKFARKHNHHNLLLLKTVPGIGDVLSLTILYEIHQIERFERVQDFLSYSRLVKCIKKSAGKVKGFGNSKQGNVHLKWAFSEAAALFLRANPAGKVLHARLVNKHGKAKALAILAAKLARSVYFMLKRNSPFDMDRFITA